MPIIDFKKLGINVMLIVVLELTADVWDKFEDSEISEFSELSAVSEP